MLFGCILLNGNCIFGAKIYIIFPVEAFDLKVYYRFVHCTVYSTLKKSYVESRQIKDDLETIIVDAAKRGREENAGNAGLEL